VGFHLHVFGNPWSNEREMEHEVSARSEIVGVQLAYNLRPFLGFDDLGWLDGGKREEGIHCEAFRAENSFNFRFSSHELHPPLAGLLS
jgi:hypothetical protein